MVGTSLTASPASGADSGVTVKAAFVGERETDPIDLSGAMASSYPDSGKWMHLPGLLKRGCMSMRGSQRSHRLQPTL